MSSRVRYRGDRRERSTKLNRVRNSRLPVRHAPRRTEGRGRESEARQRES